MISFSYLLDGLRSGITILRASSWHVLRLAIVVSLVITAVQPSIFAATLSPEEAKVEYEKGQQKLRQYEAQGEETRQEAIRIAKENMEPEAAKQVEMGWTEIIVYYGLRGWTVAQILMSPNPVVAALWAVKSFLSGELLRYMQIDEKEMKLLDETRKMLDDLTSELAEYDRAIKGFEADVDRLKRCLGETQSAVDQFTSFAKLQDKTGLGPSIIKDFAVECTPGAINKNEISICTAMITFENNEQRSVTDGVTWEYDPDYKPFAKNGIIRGAEVKNYVEGQQKASPEQKINVRARYYPKPQEIWSKPAPATATVTFKMLAQQEKAAISLSITPDRPSVSAGDTVTYKYRVENTGGQPLTNVVVSDDKCSQVKLVSGGGDALFQRYFGDTTGVLQPFQVGDYECSKKLSSSTTNTATVTARDQTNNTIHKTATATVTVVPRTVLVPDVVNMTLDSAKESITSVKLSVGNVIEEKSDIAAGLVIRQSPQSGTQVAEGTQVSLWVSQNEPRYIYIDPPRETKKLNEKVTFNATLIYKDGKQEEIEPPRLAKWEPGPDNTFTCKEAGKFIVTAEYKGASGSATVTCEEDWSVPTFEPPVSSASDRDAKVPSAGPGDYTWYAFCDPRSGEVTYGQHLLTGRKTMSGPFPGPRTVYDWIQKNCSTWRCDTNGACALKPAMGGQWKVLCGRNDLRVVLSQTYDSFKYMLIKEGFLGEPDARAWANQMYPSWSCTETGAPVPRSSASAPRRGGRWAVVCSKQHGGVSLTEYPDATRHWIWSEGFLGEPDARAWTNQNCPSWRCDAYGKCLTGVPPVPTSRPPLELPPELKREESPLSSKPAVPPPVTKPPKPPVAKTPAPTKDTAAKKPPKQEWLSDAEAKALQKELWDTYNKKWCDEWCTHRPKRTKGKVNWSGCAEEPLRALKVPSDMAWWARTREKQGIVRRLAACYDPCVMKDTSPQDRARCYKDCNARNPMPK